MVNDFYMLILYFMWLQFVTHILRCCMERCHWDTL